MSIQEKSYGSPELSSSSEDSTTPTASSRPLTLDKWHIEPIYCPPKGVVQNSTHTPNVRASQHYNIIEEFSQAPYAMSTMEVLQSLPQQCKSWLTAIKGVDPSYSSLITFDVDAPCYRLSH